MSAQPLLIVGVGASGLSAARFVKKYDLFTPYLIDAKPLDKIDHEIISELKELKIELFGSITDVLPAQLLSIGIKHAVLSPGVPPSGPIADALRRANIQMFSELELALRNCKSPAMIITGSNGKSTVTALIAHILQQSGRRAHACGNLGTAVCEILYRGCQVDSWLIIEASSYQLELTSSLDVEVGVFINLSENHLERHGDMQRYFDAKARLFLGDHPVARTAVINIDDPYGAQLFGLRRAQVRPVTNPPKRVSKLIGRHNHYNIALASAACRAIGVSEPEIETAVASFNALEHRLERLTPHFVINDSKATTVAATQAAVQAIIEEFPDRRLCLLIGGKAKRGSWQPLFECLTLHRQRLSRLVCFGGDSAYLSDQATSCGVDNMRFGSLEAATEHVCSSLAHDEIVLLSPGCASFDQFSNFEERGRVFKSLIAKLLPTL